MGPATSGLVRAGLVRNMCCAIQLYGFRKDKDEGVACSTGRLHSALQAYSQGVVEQK